MANNLERLLGKAKNLTQGLGAKDGNPSLAEKNYQGVLPDGSPSTSGGFYSDPPERPLPRPIPDYHMEPWYVDDEPDQPKYSSKYVLNRIIMTAFSLGGLVFVIGGIVYAMSMAVQIFSE